MSQKLISHQRKQWNLIFFEKRTITTVVQPRKKRKLVPSYIAGSLLKKTNEQILKNLEQKTLTKKLQATKNQKGTS